MKKNISAFVVFLLIVCFSCRQEEHVAPAKGNVTFAVSSAAKTDGRVSGTVTPAFVLLSITDSEGKVYENVKLSLFAFGSGYLSESLELPTGPAQLTKFVVLDATNEVVYATPTEGSVMAKFVSNPLPIAFTVTEEGTQVIPEVLAIEQTDTPASFGYASFGFDIVIPTINLNINLQYPDGGTYDSAYIIFRNSTGEIKKKLTVDNSTHLATGQTAITLGPWKTSISYYHQDPQANYEKMEKMGSIDINVLPTATSLTSNVSNVSITNDNNEVQTLPIEWVDYYYYDVVFQGKKEGLIRLPKDPTNPFVEVAVWNPEKWTDIYIYVDRAFYETDQTRSISRALVKIFERNPSRRACKIARRSATFSS